MQRLCHYSLENQFTYESNLKMPVFGNEATPIYAFSMIDKGAYCYAVPIQAY